MTREKVWACVTERMPEETFYEKVATNHLKAFVITLVIGFVAFFVLPVLGWVFGVIQFIPMPVLVAGFITYLALAYVFRLWEHTHKIPRVLLGATVYFVVMILAGELVGFALIIFGILMTVALLVSHNTLAVLLMWRDLKAWAREQKTATPGNDDSTPAIEPAAGASP